MDRLDKDYPYNKIHAAMNELFRQVEAGNITNQYFQTNNYTPHFLFRCDGDIDMLALFKALEGVVEK